METFSALLVLCAGKSPVTSEVTSQRPVTRSFDVFVNVRLNKRLSKQSWVWWFETPSRPLWRQSNGVECRSCPAYTVHPKNYAHGSRFVLPFLWLSYSYLKLYFINRRELQAKQPSRIWINKQYDFYRNNNITKSKQSIWNRVHTRPSTKRPHFANFVVNGGTRGCCSWCQLYRRWRHRRLS